MSGRPGVAVADESREQRIEALMRELRPKVDEAVRKMVERAVEEDGAAPVAALRALYVSGGKLWDGFWSQPHRAAA